ncbi:unnamed protein product [Effrenium voratum]|uniref:Rieske domain-containing protein n=1 Tax=Effrenium voratum TaxID=2562239 RepID=A0AA36IL39_9DINO|nr:unnamed protein product [Effrenium voratum]
MAARLLGEPLVLFRDEENRPRCLADRCPHKNAKLSVGRVRQGKMECFYHGWQFDSRNGKVDCIPFLLPGRSIPPQAQTKSYPCVEKYHLIWVWPGESQADESLIPWYPEFSDEKANFWGRSNECPVDASLWLENLMDLAHTPFAHDGQFASREQGRPLKYHTKATKGGLVAETEFFGAPESDPKQSTEWVAPITSIVSVKFPGGTWLRLHFYSVPMAPGACRFIMTLYRDWGYLLQKAMDAAEWFPPLRAMVAQMDMTVPFQDMISMTGQARNMKEGCPPLSVPIQCDEMAVHFRRWWGKAFTRDVWWKGWNGKMDMEDMTESALQACFGADACGQYERDITFAANSGGSRNCRPYVDRWATTHYKRSPFESSWWSTFALVLSAGLAGAAFTALSRR